MLERLLSFLRAQGRGYSGSNSSADAVLFPPRTRNSPEKMGVVVCSERAAFMLPTTTGDVPVAE